MDYRQVAITVTGKVGGSFFHAVEAVTHFVETCEGRHLHSVETDNQGKLARTISVQVPGSYFAHALRSAVKAYRGIDVQLVAA